MVLESGFHDRQSPAFLPSLPEIVGESAQVRLSLEVGNSKAECSWEPCTEPVTFVCVRFMGLGFWLVL